MSTPRLTALAARIGATHPQVTRYDTRDGEEVFGYHKVENPDDVSHFNMARYQFECNAPSCIAGHAAYMAANDPEFAVPLPWLSAYGGEWYRGMTAHEVATEYLEMTMEDAHSLFTPDEYDEYDYESYEDIPKETAVAVIEGYINTGIVDWFAARENAEAAEALEG